MKAILKHVLALAGLAVATQAAAQITFYEHPGFRGESFIIHQSIGNLQGVNNNRASSAVVRGEAWEVCDAPGFGAAVAGAGWRTGPATDEFDCVAQAAATRLHSRARPMRYELGRQRWDMGS